MGLSSFAFVQWAPKDASILQQSADRKRIFTSNSRSRSFKVIHFAISFRQTRGSMSMYNIAGLISEDSEQVATQIAKNCRRRQPPLSFDTQKEESLAYIFVADSMGLSSFKFVQWTPQRPIFSATECVLAFQGHSRSSKVDDFGTNQKPICDFLLVINSDFGPILHRFRDTATYWLEIAYYSYPSLIWRPRSLCFLWNFALKLTTRKPESRGYLTVKTP